MFLLARPSLVVVAVGEAEEHLRLLWALMVRRLFLCVVVFLVLHLQLLPINGKAKLFFTTTKCNTVNN